MTDQKIELSDGHCFGQQQILADSIENFILHEKSDSLWPEIYKAWNRFDFWTELV